MITKTAIEDFLDLRNRIQKETYALGEFYMEVFGINTEHLHVSVVDECCGFQICYNDDDEIHSSFGFDPLELANIDALKARIVEKKKQTDKAKLDEIEREKNRKLDIERKEYERLKQKFEGAAL